MYTPEYSKAEPDSNLELIREFPLGLVISALEGNVQTSLLPFIAREEKDGLFLIGHLARANPLWRTLQDSIVTVSFQGPQRYISPSLYVKPNNVPTWNYATVQCEGVAELIHEPDQIESILKESVEFFEKRNGSNWKYKIPADERDQLLKAILGLKIKITKIQGKFKLSQNRSAADYEAVTNFLKHSPSSEDQRMWKWMQKTKTGN